MKVYGSKKEVEKDVVNGTLLIDDDVTFNFNLSCKWRIIARNIKALNIKALNIQSWDIEAHDIDALDIFAGNIKARNIDAHDIKGHNIDANDIEFYGYAMAYSTFKCKSILGQTENAKYFCSYSDVIITG